MPIGFFIPLPETIIRDIIAIKELRQKNPYGVPGIVYVLGTIKLAQQT